ncbi:MAG TPA: hypothetical protein VKV77_02820, partial [Methylovirgula sp.]|nr:hypothetical protein [Methylovirgula sp.]
SHIIPGKSRGIAVCSKAHSDFPAGQRLAPMQCAEGELERARNDSDRVRAAVYPRYRNESTRLQGLAKYA